MGTQFDREIAYLLHRRLRVVGLITLLPLLIFFLRNLLLRERAPGEPIDTLDLGLHALVVGVINALTIVLWTRGSLSLCALRSIEVGLFGLLTLYFGFLQWHIFGMQALFAAAEHDAGVEVVRLWIDVTALRWFFLLVIYGVFIPNHWRRCAWMVGLTALVPLLVTPLSAWWHGRFSPDTLMALFDLSVLVGTSTAVALFGSYRFEQLQQQAFHAKQLGQYRLGKKLGSGGMGEVYEAEHVLLRRRCAIKLIRPEQIHDPSVLQRFEREVQTMATLTHPNTAEIYDFGRSGDGTFYYVMEYLPGLTLETLVTRHGPLPPERAIHFLRQVCRALREAHGIGLLHRDIKPSNIIACQRGGVEDVAKLLDFGLVQSRYLSPDAGRITLQGMVLGSPPYMSPEQAVGRADLDARADIYSLGGVGYFLLTGQPPFARETPMEMMLAHAYEPVVAPVRLRDGIPDDLQQVLLRCLSKKPEGRYASAEELERALASCASADLWTEERAAAWWSEAVSGETFTADVPTMITTPGP